MLGPQTGDETSPITATTTAQIAAMGLAELPLLLSDKASSSKQLLGIAALMCR
jgi:hypothetical protein